MTATDISVRALRLAATTAALNGLSWDLREGSLLEPVADERFDLVVANPPFVVSRGLRAGQGGFDYRDSGYAGDGLSRALIRALPGVLADDGTAQLLANWTIGTEQTWDERLTGLLAGLGCDAWVWQREVVEPGEYVALWLRDAGEQPGSERWRRRYGGWREWFATEGVAAVGMGLVTLRRTGSADPVVVCEDVPQAVEQPVGAAIDAWFDRARWLAGIDDAVLTRARLRAADDAVLTSHARRGRTGWSAELRQLRLANGMRWEVEVDDAVAALVAGCDGTTELRAPLTVLAASLQAAPQDVTRALLPVVRDLIGRGFLTPEDQR